ncbi:MAG: hypothetical protein AB1508_15070 [Pseudomonadota bacterium]|mgnify:CR=1 FL=1
MNMQTHKDMLVSTAFYSALKDWDEKNARRKFQLFNRRGDLHKAVFAAWWFIENVSESSPDRADLFLKVRHLVRKAQMLE